MTGQGGRRSPLRFCVFPDTILEECAFGVSPRNPAIHSEISVTDLGSFPQFFLFLYQDRSIITVHDDPGEDSISSGRSDAVEGRSSIKRASDDEIRDQEQGS